MSTIQIKHRYTGAVLYEHEPTDEQQASGLAMRAALEAAVKCNADLSDAYLIDANLIDADLIDANLCGANLRGASLIGASLRGASLRGANLRGASLIGASLSGANLRGADLIDANLIDANLIDAYLIDAYLRDANLIDASLRGASLIGASLSGANLRGADLRGANLSGADLIDANLCGAYLRGASLRDANLSGANGADLVIAMTRILPDGDLVGWKKCRDGVIVKLRIPAEAKRSHAFGRKCRAEFADVLEVIGAEVGISSHDDKTEYRTGQRVTPDSFDDNWMEECSHGVHFFITRLEAEAY